MYYRLRASNIQSNIKSTLGQYWIDNYMYVSRIDPNAWLLDQLNKKITRLIMERDLG